MIGMLVPLKGGIGSIFHPPEGKDYKWYISGIYCQLGDYMPPTTLALLGGWAPRSWFPWLITMVSDRFCPLNGVVGPLTNGLFMAYKWRLLTSY